jgi:ADP-heptose:LPS heptosyltransferase
MPSSSLVYHTGGLGDFITTFPAIGEWNRQNPQGRKILLGKPSYGILGIHAGVFDEIWDVESAAFSWLYSPALSVPLLIKEKMQAIRSALLFCAQDSPVLSRFKDFNVANLLYQEPFPSYKIPICDYHLSLIKKGPFLNRGDFPTFFPHPDFKTDADRLIAGLGKFVAMSPGSGSAVKNWPFERFVGLAEKLSTRGYECLWFLGPAEEEFQVPNNGVVVRNTSLPALVHVLSWCRLYVGNDSGMSHLAGACGAPCVVLFGPSDPDIWRPLGKTVAVVSENRRPCFPCHEGKGNAFATRAVCADPCIGDISVSRVFDVCMSAAVTI